MQIVNDNSVFIEVFARLQDCVEKMRSTEDAQLREIIDQLDERLKLAKKLPLSYLSNSYIVKSKEVATELADNLSRFQHDLHDEADLTPDVEVDVKMAFDRFKNLCEEIKTALQVPTKGVGGMKWFWLSSGFLCLAGLLSLFTQSARGFYCNIGNTIRNMSAWGMCICVCLLIALVPWMPYLSRRIGKYFVSLLAIVWEWRRMICVPILWRCQEYPPSRETADNGDVEKMLRLYFESSKTDYALMINGAWGTGKTYYVQHAVNDLLRQCKKKSLYVSLNGVTSFEDVAAQIVFSTRWPFMGKIAHSVILPFAAKWLPEKSISFICSQLKNISERKAQSIDFSGEYDLTVDGHVIFVDDLERVADVGKEQDGRLLMDIIGRLFDEFISRGYHVVFIGAESEMGDKPRFFAEKEKYIRHTVDFAPNIPNVISSIVESHRGVARHHARLVASFLRSFAKTYHVDNIRTIKRILDSFIFLAEKVNDEALLSKSADKIMEILAPTVNERAAGVFRGKSTDDILAQTKSGGASGNLDEKEWCKSLVALYNHFYTSEGEGKIGAEDSSAKQTERLGDYVKNRYKRQSCLCKWSENSSIVYFAITGLIDNDSLKRELLSWIPPHENQYLKALDIVWQFESIEDDDFKKMCPIVIDGLKSGQYNAEHANLAYSLIYHFNQNGWMSIDCESLIRETVSALESRWGVMPDDYINPMLLHNRQEDFLQPIIDVIQAEKVRREKKLANDEAQKFLDALENKDKDAVWSICPECQTCLIFDKIVESNKCSEFCSVSNWALHLVWYVLKEREPFIRPSSRNSIERLVEEFDKTIQVCDKDRPLRKARLKEVYERFVEILNKPEFKRSSDDSCAQKH